MIWLSNSTLARLRDQLRTRGQRPSIALVQGPGGGLSPEAAELLQTTAEYGPLCEAMYLMMKRAFDELGYRRYEWKCDDNNLRSRAAAQRYGFTFEGIFRQAIVYKGRSRDTAWYSIVDREWPALRAAYERWLDPANFDANGVQRASLGSLTGSAGSA